MTLKEIRKFYNKVYNIYLTKPYEWKKERHQNGSLIYKRGNGINYIDVTDFTEEQRTFIRDWYIMNTIGKDGDRTHYFIEDINRETEFYKEKFTNSRKFQKVTIWVSIIALIISLVNVGVNVYNKTNSTPTTTTKIVK